MMRYFFPVHTFLLTLLVVVSLQSSVAWLGLAGHLFQHTAAALVLSATLMGSPAPQPPMLGKELQSNLQPPTENRPQIQIPRNLQQSPEIDDKNTPIVEALLYLVNPQIRPDITDTIVITVRDAANTDTKVLAGAKIPAIRARFPVELRLFPQNIIDKQAWEQAGDVIVRATVCPSDSKSIPCSDGEATMKAEGISKLVRNLPGLPSDITVRAGASLPLK